MHEVTNVRSSVPMYRGKLVTTAKVIRSDSLPGKPARVKLTPSPMKTVHRRNTVNVPVVTRDHLAHRFRQNWLAKYPMDTCSNGATNLDDSLTSLNWLQNLNIMKLASPTPPPSPLTVTDQNTKVNPNAVLNMTHTGTPNTRMEPRVNIYGDLTPPPSMQDKVDYKANPCVKPPYSYATLICMSMQETQKQKITLSSIYNWITENFAYYRMAEPSWQNSIRHNLSLNKCFQKVPRRKDEPGKGGFWCINPEFNDSFENGVFKKRRCSRDSYSTVNVPPLKRIKKEADDGSYDNSQGTSDSSSSTGFQHEDSSNPFMNFPGVISDDDGEMLSRELNWSSLLGQDIQVDGRTVKAEDLLDGSEQSLASPLIDMSPPPSETNSDDMPGLEDLLSQTDFSQTGVALDFTTNDPLDLTVSGTGLNPPNWWSESFNLSGDTKELIEAAASASSTARTNGLHTPIAQSPAYEDDGLSWDHHSMPAAFDVDNLFDIENIPSPQL